MSQPRPAIPSCSSELYCAGIPSRECASTGAIAGGAYAGEGDAMKTIAVASAPADAQARTIAARQILLVWTVPILYPLSLSAIFRSVELTQANVALGSGLLALAIAWSMAGPVTGWLSLNYL